MKHNDFCSCRSALSPHKDNVKDKLFGIIWSGQRLAKQRDRVLSVAMMDCRLVPGQDEVTIHQGGRAPCSTDVRGHVAERHLVDVGLSTCVQSAAQNNALRLMPTASNLLRHRLCLPWNATDAQPNISSSTSQYAVRSLPRWTMKPLALLMLVSYHLKANAPNVSNAYQKRPVYQ